MKKSALLALVLSLGLLSLVSATAFFRPPIVQAEGVKQTGARGPAAFGNQLLSFSAASTFSLMESIACGETKTNRALVAGQQDTYTFSGNAGEAVILTAVGTSGNVCAYAELYRAGVYLGRNSCNSYSSSLTLPANDIYTILVYDSGLNDTGTYDLNLQFTTGRCGTAITCGQTRSGNLTSKAQQDTYKFSANAGEAVLFSAVGTSTSGAVCSYAELYSPSGVYLGRNSCNSYSSSLSLPATGTYTLLVYDSGHNDNGTYDLNLQFTTGRCGTAITCGQTRSGNLTSKAQQDTFSFCGLAGSSVIVSTAGTSGGVCVYAELYDPSGTYRGRNSCNSNSSSLSLPATGTYTLLVYDSGHNGTGTYNVNLSCFGNSCPPQTFGVSGRVTAANGAAISGVTMNFTRLSGTGSVPASVTTDANGNWSQTGFTPGSNYRVTPVRAGCTFSPSALDFSSANTGLNFIGNCPPTCPAAQIEIVPSSPTATDNVSVRISGQWPDACIPRNAQVVIAGNEIRINTSNPGQVCAQVLTPYNLVVPVGRLDAGDYRVVVTHTSSGGQCELGRRNFTVTPPPPACVGVSISPTLSAPANSSLTVPVRVSDLTGKSVLSYDFTLAFDPAVLRLQNLPFDRAGTLSSAMTVTFNTGVAGKLTISAFGSTPLTGSGTLLNLKFDVIGTRSACSNLILEAFRFNEGTPCATLSNGRVCVSPEVTLSGAVSYCITPTKKVAGVVVRTNTTPSVTDTTDNTGNYAVRVPSGSSLTLTPSKSGEVNGISSFDAALVAQCVVGITQCTSCQRTAGDASNDGSLSSFDASLIARYVAGLPNTGGVGTWEFVPPSYSFSALSSDQTNQNFNAVLIGDVSGNWTPSSNNLLTEAAALSRQTRSTPAAAEVMVSLPETSGLSGANVTLPITVGDLTGQGVVAYDFELAFDPNVLQFQSPPIEAVGTLSSAMTITPNTSTPGRLQVSAFSTNALTGAGALLNLKFTVVGAPGTSTALAWQRFQFNEGEPQAMPVNGRFNVTTPAVLPTVTTAAATAITSTGAVLNGTVNPNGSATNISFEWGTDSALANFNTTPPQPAGAGTASVPVSANLSGLTAGTTYYFRLAGTNSAGTARDSSILSFSTQSTPSNPLPVAQTLSPGSATAGGGDFTLTVNGRDFVSGAAVRWNGAPRPTTYVSSTQLTAAIAAADIATAGTASVTVFNPEPGGGASDALSFTISSAGLACEAVQQALDQGGVVTLEAALYTCRTPLVIRRNNTWLRGQGPATQLRLADNANAPVIVIGQTVATPTETRRNVRVSDLMIDGNRLNQTSETSPAEPALRNNGISVRRAEDVLIEHVTVRSARSGGLVTELGCRRITVRDFTSYDNHFDGLAGYETEDSLFSGLYLYDNLAAGLSFDIRFNKNTLSDVVITGSRTVGIFMRDARDNLFKGLQIKGSREHGIFLAQVDDDATKPAAGNAFVGLLISGSMGAGVRVNNASCVDNLVCAAQFINNRDGGISEAVPNLVRGCETLVR